MAFKENNSSNSSTKIATLCSSAKIKVANQEAERRFTRESNRLDMEEYAADQSREVQRAEWEVVADRRTTRSRVRREFGRLEVVMEEELNDRRGRLFDLLRDEDDLYLQELMQDQEQDPGAKSERMLARYLELKTRKEEERQRIAEEKREQQFKLNCDELRARLSRRLQVEVAQESRRAASENRMRKEVAEADAMYSDMWRRDSEAKLAREEWEAGERRRKAKEAGEEVAQQLEDERKGRWRELLRKEEEAEVRAEQNRLLVLEAECAKEAKRRNKENVRRDLDACLIAKMDLRAQEAREDVLEDIFFVTQAMGEAEDKAERDERKRRLLCDQRAFLQHQRDRGKKDHQADVEADRLCREAEEERWARRREEEEKEEGRRRRKGVQEGVQGQMADNVDRLKKIQCANKEYGNKVLEEDENDRRREKERTKLAREKNLEYQKELLDQIRTKQEKLKQEKDLENSEQEELRLAREREDTKIRHMVADMKIDREHPYRVGRREVFHDCGDG